MYDLKPCPFCGSIHAEVKQDIRGVEAYHVVCNCTVDGYNCPMICGMPYRKTIEQAVSDWNTRYIL